MNVTCYKLFDLLDVSEKTTIYRMLIGGGGGAETTWGELARGRNNLTPFSAVEYS